MNCSDMNKVHNSRLWLLHTCISFCQLNATSPPSQLTTKTMNPIKFPTKKRQQQQNRQPNPQPNRQSNSPQPTPIIPRRINNRNVRRISTYKRLCISCWIRRRRRRHNTRMEDCPLACKRETRTEMREERGGRGTLRNCGAGR
jgi:hypothetical protein